MKLNGSWQIRLAQISLGAALVIVALVVVHGTNAQNDPVHMTTDWSHRHLVFSTPKTLVDRFQASSNPRYVQQWVRRNAEKKVDREASRWARAQTDPVKKDWSMDMGFNATLGAGMYPAKFAFDVSTASCSTAPQPDFVVYNTSLTGNSTAVAATAAGTFTGLSNTGATITITNGAKVLTMKAAALNGVGTYARNASTITEAQNLFNAINIPANGPNTVGVTATSHPNSTVNFAAVAGVAGNNITVSSTLSSRFTWSTPTFTGGANGRASIMAFDNLYSGCTGTVPTPYWAYNTGGLAVTSVSLSFDGTQVAFAQNIGGAASLVILKWKASATDNFNNPTTPLAVSNAAYRNCVAPCMTSIAFSVTGSARADTNSSPFYDFAQDTLYVGDTGGRLRKFVGVFLHTPAEITAGGWPVRLNPATTAVTTGAVYDYNVQKVFIGDAGGFLYSVTTSGVPVTVISGRLGFSRGITDAPIVDPTAGTVHVYVSNDSGAGTGDANHSRVYQLSDNFTAGSTGASVTIGDSSPALRAFPGDFDNIYYSSPSGNAGNMYVCGFQSAGIGNQVPTLWQIPMTGGTMGTPIEGPALTTGVAGGTSCSPVVEVFNPNAGPATDWIYVSVVNHSLTALGCGGGGCLMSFDVTSGAPITPSTLTSATLDVTGGASGLVMDNTVDPLTFAGASQIYFTPLANQVCTTSGGLGGCAIQASQATLF